MIELIIDDLPASRLSFGADAERTAVPLHDPAWTKFVIQSLGLLPDKLTAYPASGWIEKKFRSRVKADSREWPLSNAPVGQNETLARGLEGIRQDLYPFWHWAEHRANTYRDLFQGAYVTIAFLALLAVAGALTGVVVEEDYGKLVGKAIESSAILALLLLWKRAYSGRWRQRWLGYRYLEQEIRNAAVLKTLGRTVPVHSSPVEHEVQQEGGWLLWYLQAILRQAKLPTGKLDAVSLQCAGEVIQCGQVGRQIEFYEKAIHHNHRAHERLEWISLAALWAAFLTAALYLVNHAYPVLPHEPVRLGAIIAGLFGPALAATLAAIRAQGEFLQLELRYRGMKVNLERMQRRLSMARANAGTSSHPLFSAQLAKLSRDSATWMLEEVSLWRSLLHTNEIER